jgi:tRNA(fMet)-specific endonuclease VapC
MTGKVLLDTNIVIALFADEASVKQQLAIIGEIFIPSIVLVKGKPIPENDIWIAAIAEQHQLTLVTRDSHFQHVDGLVIEQW